MTGLVRVSSLNTVSPGSKPAARETMTMTPRERVEAVLFGGSPDHVPFTVYECMLPQCEVERKIRNEGTCIHQRHYPVYAGITPNCTSESHSYTDSETGKYLVETITHTPAGDLSAVMEPAGFTSWRRELPFKQPGDYARIIALANDTGYLPAYDAPPKAYEWIGGDQICVTHMGYSPLQAIIYDYMGVETFAIEWSERRDEVMKLYDALAARDRRCFEVVAHGPDRFVQYCGNVSPYIVSPKNFRELILPLYNEFGNMLHEQGKLLGVHMDADCGPYADMIGESAVDVIEAFTPAPDTDMSIAQARAAWPEKILWTNFPSSVHLSHDETVYQTACRMIDEDGGAQKLIIGITEDVPENRWPSTFEILSRTCAEYGRYR